MSNHFHLEIETPQPNLSVGMKWLRATTRNDSIGDIEIGASLFAGRYVFICRMVKDAATIKDSTMKTILMLIVGLMFAGCGSMENHVRTDGLRPAPAGPLEGPAPPTSAGPLAGPGDRIAVDTICACP